MSPDFLVSIADFRMLLFFLLLLLMIFCPFEEEEKEEEEDAEKRRHVVAQEVRVATTLVVMNRVLKHDAICNVNTI